MLDFALLGLVKFIFYKERYSPGNNLGNLKIKISDPWKILVFTENIQKMTFQERRTDEMIASVFALKLMCPFTSQNCHFNLKNVFSLFSEMPFYFLELPFPLPEVPSFSLLSTYFSKNSSWLYLLLALLREIIFALCLLCFFLGLVWSFTITQKFGFDITFTPKEKKKNTLCFFVISIITILVIFWKISISQD